MLGIRCMAPQRARSTRQRRKTGGSRSALQVPMRRALGVVLPGVVSAARCRRLAGERGAAHNDLVTRLDYYIHNCTKSSASNNLLTEWQLVR